MLPFQGFTELLTEDDQRRVLAAVHGALRPGGRFICTSHNPAVRSRSIDGSWRRVGDFAAARNGALHVSLRAELAEAGRVARGQQRVEVLDAGGERREEIVLDLEFSLTPASRILELAAAAGFACTALQGDYSGAPFDDASSPVIIALLDKPV